MIGGLAVVEAHLQRQTIAGTRETGRTTRLAMFIQVAVAHHKESSNGIFIMQMAIAYIPIAR